MKFLLEGRTQTGWWRDFPGLDGGSDEWVTAFTAAALATLPEDEARCAARNAWALLRERHTADGGWGYHPGMPVDADSTACRSPEVRATVSRRIGQTNGGARMELSLSPDVQKLINERVNSGKYPTPGDVVAAALRALDQQEWFGDFEAGELEDLLAEGERNINGEGTLDGDEAFRLRSERRAQRRKSRE